VRFLQFFARKMQEKFIKNCKKMLLSHKKLINLTTIMKHFFLYLIIVLTTHSVSLSQSNFTRGSDPGELYLSESWYGIYDPNWGPPYYDTLKTAIYRLTENGKKLTKQYDADYFANIEFIMQPQIILSDAAQGVVYTRNTYYKNSYEHTRFWISFDYGRNWTSIEENIGRIGYFAAGLKEGILYKGGENRSVLQSRNFGKSFDYFFSVPIPYSTREIGYQECEFFGFGNSYHDLQYTKDCANSFTVIPIGEQFVFGQICGIFPDVYRGGLPGEVYIDSWFPDGSYKVSFSADTGHTFRHVYVANHDCTEDGSPVFMSDREPGVFYIIKSYEIEDFNPYGWHTKICVEYYRDYGETLVDTYCHDITKDYGSGVGVEPITNYELRITVYPNPAFNTVTIETNSFSKAEIYNAMGQLLKTVTTNIVDVSPYTSGVYFLKVFDMENNSATKRVVVVR